MRKTLISGIVAAGILTMPLAHADGNIDEFNQYLLQHGIASDTASTNGLTYLANGQNACAAKRAGVSNCHQPQGVPFTRHLLNTLAAQHVHDGSSHCGGLWL